MEHVQAFHTELASLYEMKPPISKAKMMQITKLAMKAIKWYKHVVLAVEKFILKCKTEYKIPGLYVIDAIVRQSRHQFDERDVFGPRFCRNLAATFEALFKSPIADQPRIVKVLALWQRNSVLPLETVTAMLQLCKENGLDISNVEFLGNKKSRSGTDVSAAIKDEPETEKTASDQMPSAKKAKSAPEAKTPPKEEESVDQKLYDQITNLTNQLMSGNSDAHMAQKSLMNLIGPPQMVEVINSKGAGPKDSKVNKILSDNYDYSDDSDNEGHSSKPQSSSELASNLMKNSEFMAEIQKLQKNIRSEESGSRGHHGPPGDLTRLTDGGMITPVPPFNRTDSRRPPEPVPAPHFGGLGSGMPPQFTPQSMHMHSMWNQQPPPDFNNMGAHIPPAEPLPPEIKALKDKDERIGKEFDKEHKDGKKSKRKRQQTSRSKSRSKSRSRSRSRELSKKHKRGRSERSSSRGEVKRSSKRRRSGSRERQREKDKERRRQGLPPLKDRHALICSRTLWAGRLPLGITEDQLLEPLKQYGTAVKINLIPPRGCAYITMLTRKSAYKTLDRLYDTELEGRRIKMAWAPGAGVKEQFRDLFDGDNGATYIPWDILPPDLVPLMEGGNLDIESLPDIMKDRYRSIDPIDIVAHKMSSGLADPNMFAAHGFAPPPVVSMTPVEPVQQPPNPAALIGLPPGPPPLAPPMPQVSGVGPPLPPHLPMFGMPLQTHFPGMPPLPPNMNFGPGFPPMPRMMQPGMNMNMGFPNVSGPMLFPTPNTPILSTPTPQQAHGDVDMRGLGVAMAPTLGGVPLNMQPQEPTPHLPPPLFHGHAGFLAGADQPVAPPMPPRFPERQESSGNEQPELQPPPPGLFNALAGRGRAGFQPDQHDRGGFNRGGSSNTRGRPPHHNRFNEDYNNSGSNGGSSRGGGYGGRGGFQPRDDYRGRGGSFTPRGRGGYDRGGYRGGSGSYTGDRRRSDEGGSHYDRHSKEKSAGVEYDSMGLPMSFGSTKNSEEEHETSGDRNDDRRSDRYNNRNDNRGYDRGYDQRRNYRDNDRRDDRRGGYYDHDRDRRDNSYHHRDRNDRSRSRNDQDRSNRRDNSPDRRHDHRQNEPSNVKNMTAPLSRWEPVDEVVPAEPIEGTVTHHVPVQMRLEKSSMLENINLPELASLAEEEQIQLPKPSEFRMSPPVAAAAQKQRSPSPLPLVPAEVKPIGDILGSCLGGDGAYSSDEDDGGDDGTGSAAHNALAGLYGDMPPPRIESFPTETVEMTEKQVEKDDSFDAVLGSIPGYGKSDNDSTESQIMTSAPMEDGGGGSMALPGFGEDDKEEAESSSGLFQNNEGS